MLASLAAQLLIKKFITTHHFQWPITALIGLVNFPTKLYVHVLYTSIV